MLIDVLERAWHSHQHTTLQNHSLLLGFNFHQQRTIGSSDHRVVYAGDFMFLAMAGLYISRSKVQGSQAKLLVHSI